MINKFSIGFVVTAAVIVAGVDYFDQSKKTGLSLGQMSASAYSQTISDRFIAAKDEKQAQLDERERQSLWRQGGQVFLPEAPEGWTRRALLEGDDTPIMPPEARELGDGVGKSFLEQQNAQKHLKEQKQRAERSWIYQRGTETVYVEVQLTERPDNNSLIGLVASTLDGVMADNFNRDLGFGVYGGFGLTEKMASDGNRPYHFRYLEGAIGFGQEVHLKVHANASRAATEEILNAIDYDGLNTLLPEPLPFVGNDFVLPAGMDPIQTSLDLRAIKSEFLSLRALEAQNRIANLDTNAMLLNVYATQLGGTGDFDITGGKVKNLSDIVTLGYRMAVLGVMEGNSYQQVQADVTHMVETAMMVVDAETAAAAAKAANAPEPEMSPELKAELARLAGTGQSDGQTRQAQLDPVLKAQIAAQNRARGMDSSAPGQVVMIVDEQASDRAAGKVVSQAIDRVAFETFRDARNITAPEMKMGMMIAAEGFEKKHGLAKGTCDFAMARLRIECDAARQTADAGGGGVVGLLGKLTGQESNPVKLQPKNTEPPKRLELSGSKPSSGKRCVGSFCD